MQAFLQKSPGTGSLCKGSPLQRKAPSNMKGRSPKAGSFFQGKAISNNTSFLQRLLDKGSLLQREGLQQQPSLQAESCLRKASLLCKGAAPSESDIHVPLQLAHSILQPLLSKLLSKLPLASMSSPVVSFDGQCMANDACLHFMYVMCLWATTSNMLQCVRTVSRAKCDRLC